MCAAPFFDLWMDKRETREVLCVSMAFLVVGSVMYVLLPSTYTLFGILMSRLMVGVAAGMYVRRNLKGQERNEVLMREREKKKKKKKEKNNLLTVNLNSKL